MGHNLHKYYNKAMKKKLAARRSLLRFYTLYLPLTKKEL